MKYFKKYPFKDRFEISCDEALGTLIGTYRDNDMTRDMLTIPNHIKCRYSDIFVEDHDENGHVQVCMPGLINLLPMDAEYDDDGNRL